MNRSSSIRRAITVSIACARGEAKEAWFLRYVCLPDDISSHGAFSDVFAKIGPDMFEQCFVFSADPFAQSLLEAPEAAAIGRLPLSYNATADTSQHV